MNKKLPRQLALPLMQSTWASMLEPIISQPVLDNVYLEDVKLVTGKNVINHKLGRKLVGWIPTRIKAAATFYDDQDNNQAPALTLVLYASADCTIDLVVF